MANSVGDIIIRQGANPWEHELRTAEALASAGLTVIFLAPDNENHHKNADVEIDGIVYEMKSPKSNRLSNVQRTLQKALDQSSNVIYDTRRIKDLMDSQVERELRKQAATSKRLKRLLLVTKKRQVITIK